MGMNLTLTTMTAPSVIWDAPSRNAASQHLVGSKLSQGWVLQAGGVSHQLPENRDRELQLDGRAIHRSAVAKPCIDFCVKRFIGGGARGRQRLKMWGHAVQNTKIV
jgi:hypothetical protein